MRVIGKAALVAGALVLLPMLLGGCVVWEEPWWHHYPPRAATFYLYVYDYYSGVPIPWAAVELYQEDWWSWDYIGTWPMSPYGYAVATGGYIEYDGCGGCEEDFRLIAYASGYYTESCEVSVDYMSPSRTVRFYLAPWPLAKERPGERAPELGPGEGPENRVRIEEPREPTNE